MMAADGDDLVAHRTGVAALVLWRTTIPRAISAEGATLRRHPCIAARHRTGPRRVATASSQRRRTGLRARAQSACVVTHFIFYVIAAPITVWDSTSKYADRAAPSPSRRGDRLPIVLAYRARLLGIVPRQDRRPSSTRFWRGEQQRTPARAGAPPAGLDLPGRRTAATPEDRATRLGMWGAHGMNAD